MNDRVKGFAGLGLVSEAHSGSSRLPESPHGRLTLAFTNSRKCVFSPAFLLPFLRVCHFAKLGNRFVRAILARVSYVYYTRGLKKRPPC